MPRRRQVAILDNGTAATRTGAIVGLAPSRVRAGQAGARVEHARRDRLRRQAHQPRQRRRGGLRTGDRRSGLDRPRERRQQPDVRRRADQGTGRRHDRADDHDPQRPGRLDAAAGHAVHAGLRVRRRAGPGRVHGDADRRRHARPLHVQASRPRTPPATRRASRAPTPSSPTPRRPGSRRRHGPATLALTLGAPASFGAFTPGVAKVYTASTTATVVSTAGDATLSITDPSTTNPGRLVNGTFALPAAAARRGLAAAGDRQDLERPDLQRVRPGRLHPGDRRR